MPRASVPDPLDERLCCPKCEHSVFYFLETRKLHQCTRCKHQASVTAGTIMHKSHTPLLNISRLPGFHNRTDKIKAKSSEKGRYALARMAMNI